MLRNLFRRRAADALSSGSPRGCLRARGLYSRSAATFTTPTTRGGAGGVAARPFHVLATCDQGVSIASALTTDQQSCYSTGSAATSPSRHTTHLINSQQQFQRGSTTSILVRHFKTENAYHTVADQTLEGLLDGVEGAIEDMDNPDAVVNVDDMEITLAAGVLTLHLPPHGTWVLNKQTPNQQIWWSSPLSGPKRFEYDDSNGKDDTSGSVWFCTQNGLSLVPLLAQELSHVLKTEITLEVDLD